MTKEALIETAKGLTQPTEKTANEYLEKCNQLAATINKIMLARLDLTDLIGQNNTDMMQDNHRNHARFLSSVFVHYNPTVLVETVLWVFRAYRNHGFQLTYWPAQLDTWIELYKQELTPDAYKEIYPFYHWMLINQPFFVRLSDELVISENTPKH